MSIAAIGRRCPLLVVGMMAAIPAARGGATCVPTPLAAGLHANYELVDREGSTRRYDLYLPAAYDAASAGGAKPLPLVVDLHGFTAGKEDQALVSGFRPKADAVGFIVAYPNGRDQNPADPTDNAMRGWNAYNCCGPAYNAGGYDDVGYIRDLVADVSAKVNVDHRRIYITGISNGGDMTHRLACEAADLFAAAAPFSFDLPLPDANQGITACTPSRPIPITIFRGYREGNSVISSYCPSTIWDPPFPGAQAGLAAWAQADGCTDVPALTVWSPSTTQVACFPPSTDNVTQTYSSCGGVHVKLTSWDAGHATIYAFSDGANKAWDYTLGLFTLPGLPDADGDGVADVDDDCLDTPNADQTDADHDCRGDACESAPPLSGPTPLAGCREVTAAKKAALSMKANADPTKDRLSWRWAKGAATALADYGDPVGRTDYALCVYDETGGTPALATTAAIPHGGLWKPIATQGFRYKDAARANAGIGRVILKSGAAGKAMIVVKGKGSALPLPALPLHDDAAVTTQLVSSDGPCWTGTFPAPASVNTATVFKDSGR